MSPRTPVRRVTVVYNPGTERAKELASELSEAIAGRGVQSAVTDASDAVATRAQFGASDLVVTFGGDGTVLRCSRLGMGLTTPLLGVNLGRLGFLTEVESHEMCERLDDVLAGKGRVEERAMLEASVPRRSVTFHALNEVVIGRAQLSRAIQVAVDIDSVRVADYRCDGVIVASATGSTAYALSVGGPILTPESQEIVIVPVSPHLAARHAMVLPPSEAVSITLEPRQVAVLSVDGEPELDLQEGDCVEVRVSQYRARFLRLHPRTDFYKRMAAQLGWHRPGGNNSQPLPERQP